MKKRKPLQIGGRGEAPESVRIDKSIKELEGLKVVESIEIGESEKALSKVWLECVQGSGKERRVSTRNALVCSMHSKGLVRSYTSLWPLKDNPIRAYCLGCTRWIDKVTEILTGHEVIRPRKMRKALEIKKPKLKVRRRLQT